MDFVEGFGSNLNSSKGDTVAMKSILKKKDAFGVIKFEDLSNRNTNAEVAELQREIAKLKSQQSDEKKAWQSEKKSLIDNHEKKLKEELEKTRQSAQDKAKLAADAEHKAREEEIFTQLRLAMESLEREKNDFFKNAEVGMAKILSSMAKQIVGGYLEEHPEAIENSVKEVLSYIGNEKNVRLLLNSEDFAWVKPRVKDWLEIGQSQLNIELIEEKRIQRGGCILETNSGNVEVRLEDLFNRVDEIIARNFNIDK